MKLLYFLLCLLSFPVALAAQNKESYFPGKEWHRRDPGSWGFDTGRLGAAIRYAISQESKAPRNMELAQAMTFGKEPFGEGMGAFADRGAPTGVILYKGYIVAEWGEPLRVDMTHSVTKSFLSMVAGLAVDQGLIRSVHDSVASYVSHVELYDPFVKPYGFGLGQQALLEPFSSEHNRSITWNTLLRQTSDWEGTLWGKPEWADRPDAQSGNWLTRKRAIPGSVYEYNDVRVNVLALALTSVWRKPLPQVVKEKIMDPIGASTTWRWRGYRNSWIVLDGQPMQVVSGGGHWGGGMFINAHDMARFGLLTLNRGSWKGKQVVSQSWIQQSLTPTPAQPTYGFMNFFLNTEGRYLPSAPHSAFVHVGNGTNIIYVDPVHDLVMVVRWIENAAVDGMVKAVLAALK